MSISGAVRQARVGALLTGLMALAACSQPGITPAGKDGVYAPGGNLRKPAVDGIVVSLDERLDISVSPDLFRWCLKLWF